MKNFTPFLLLAALLLPSFAFTQVTQSWVQRYSTTQVDFPCTVLTDNSANAYVCGSVGGVSVQGNIITIKYNAAGAIQWTSVYNSPDNNADMPNAMVRDAAGNIYVTGISHSTGSYRAVTIKYNASGVQQWVANFNPANHLGSEGLAITTDASGNVYVAGHSDPGGYEDNYMVLKYNSAGALQWSDLYDGTGSGMDHAKFIRVDASGNVYITGESYGLFKGLNSQFDIVTIKYNSAGTRQWLKRYNGSANKHDLPNAMILDAGRNVVLTGYTMNSVGNMNMITIKYDSAGNSSWTNIYAASTTSSGQGITMDPSGNYIVTGARGNGTFGGTDMMTAKFSAAGVLQWTALYNGGHNDGGQAVATDVYGNIYVAGSMTWYTSPSFGQNDYVTVKYNSAGAQQWAVRYNGTGNSFDQATSIAIYNPPPTVFNNPTVYVTGSSTGIGTQNDFATIKYTQPSQICCVIKRSASVVEELEQPRKFSLTNYPNPFKGTTNIEYEIPEQSQVFIQIYNASGQEVATISEGQKAAGIYRKSFHAKMLSKGIYHYKVTARSATREYSETQRMSVK